MDTAVSETPPSGQKGRAALESVVIRFAGDSGDGIQLTGDHFTQSTALGGHEFATFPDYPAEIRAPAGTTYGVSAFQINFSAHEVMTEGDEPNVLVALNPAALKVNLGELRPGAMVVVNTGAFSDSNLRKAGYTENPLEDGTLAPFRVLPLDISKMTLAAVRDFGLSQKEALRCKNIWTLGLTLWMYGRKRADTIEWLKQKFAARPELAEANVAALNAGHAYGETAELPSGISTYAVPKAHLQPGLYRTIVGSEAMALGLLEGTKLAGLDLFFGSYPITPSSPLLHKLANLKRSGVMTFQAEDEIAAVCAAIGASYAGALGVTSSSGPGIALKTEAIGLAVAVELPLVIVNWQRGGPSTGLPTKTEQSDLYQAVFGRNADSPLVVMAAHSPSDCFETAIEAVRIASKFMTPVMLLADGYLASAAEPWRIPDVDEIEPFPVNFRTDPADFQPAARDETTLARNWAIPGTPGLEHRIGGIERDYDTGNISYDPANHQRMTSLRDDKIAGIADHVPEQEVEIGDTDGALAVVGWGSTYGPIFQGVRRARESGLDAAHVHLRYIWPLPANLGALLGRFDKILVPEMNNGQLVTLLRSEYLLPAESLDKVTGQPFKVSEIEDAIRSRLET